MADDPELTDLACIADMRTDAGTGIIIPYSYNAQCF
jgi:hypothetical protein